MARRNLLTIRTTGRVRQTPGVKYFVANDPITYFIYHPWFEEIYTGEGSRGSTGLHSQRIRVDRANDQQPTWQYDHYRYGPYWFGKSSTRGVLSDSIANMMKDAAYPTTELMPLTWQTGGWWYDRGDPGRGVIEYNWKLDEYIRTAVSRYTEDTGSVSFHHTDKRLKIPGGFHKYYITPHIEWEFVHPKLPIIKVTAQNSKVLPITLPGTKNPGPTEYSVSFVISFQNRWDSSMTPTAGSNGSRKPPGETDGDTKLSSTEERHRDTEKSNTRKLPGNGITPTTCSTRSSAQWSSKSTNRPCWNPGPTPWSPASTIGRRRDTSQPINRY